MILVINCGSSSAKYELFEIRKFKAVSRGIVERITGYSGYIRAIKTVKNRILDPQSGAIKSIKEIKGIGHRVVHGGELYEKSTLITKKVIRDIRRFVALAPLHNPPALAGISACKKIFPGIPQAACFDTAFHQSMPAHSFVYGLPYELYTKHCVRRYGFHGTSHRYVSQKAAEILKKPLRSLKIVTVHLGNGCSMTAVSGGVSIDTTMGFTPLEGLLMGTRSGDLDPAIVTFLMEKKNMTAETVNDFLNKECGLLGVSGVSNDMRDILKAIKKGNKRARLAFHIFIYRIKKYIGAYAAAMKGLDAVVLTAGIGENVPEIKATLARDLGPLFGKKVKFLIIPTNEELLIAKDTYRLIKKERG